MLSVIEESGITIQEFSPGCNHTMTFVICMYLKKDAMFIVYNYPALIIRKWYSKGLHVYPKLVKIQNNNQTGTYLIDTKAGNLSFIKDFVSLKRDTN